MHITQHIQSFLLPSALLASFYAIATAAPLIPRQPASCTDASQPFANHCYLDLNLSDFLTNPTYGWQTTRGGACHSGSNAAYCCIPSDTTWSGCFIRQAVDLAGKPSCSSIDSGACPTTSLTIVEEIPSDNWRKVQYVLHTIYTINQLFSSWSNVLNGSITTQTATDVHDVDSEVDPKGTTSVSAPDVIQAYLLGLPLLGTSTAGSLSPHLSSQIQVIATSLLYALQHTPSLSQALFYNATETNYPVQTSGVPSFLSDTYAQGLLLNHLNKGLGLIMSDVNVFEQFANSGNFSGSANLTLDSNQGLDVGLEKLIESAVHQDHGYLDLVNGLSLGISIP